MFRTSALFIVALVALAFGMDGGVAAQTENAIQATGGPSAPTSFLLTHQGANDAVLAWTAAVAGPSPVSYYKIYRNGVAYDKTNFTTYTDSKATNITTPG